MSENQYQNDNIIDINNNVNATNNNKFNSYENQNNQQSVYQTVAKSNKINPLKFFSWLFIIIILFAVLSAYLAQHIYVMNISFELRSKEASFRKINQKNEELQILLAKHTRMETIDKLAIEKLKMERPKRVEYIIINEEDI